MNRSSVTSADRPPTFTYIRARFPWRVAIYAAVILYLFADLYWLGGPLSRFINTFATRQAQAEGWVAQVYGRPITRGTFDHALAVHLFRRGETLADFEGEAKFAVQIRVLDELVEQRVVATWSTGEPLPGVGPGAVRSALAEFRGQFRDDADFESALASQNLDMASLGDRIEEHLRVGAWIEKTIAPATVVTDADVAAFFDDGENRGLLTAPEAVRVRHLFLATAAGAGPGDRRAEIEELHRRLSAGETRFAELAAAHSDDPRSRAQGGDLGFFTRAERMPSDFVEAVWPLPVGALSPPFRTAVGWHVAEVVERVPGRPLTLAEASPEIRAFLESERRAAAVANLRAQIRQRAKGNVAYYYHVLLDENAQRTAHDG
jgi:foldase protein PrsA